MIYLPTADEALVEIIRSLPMPMQSVEMGELIYRYTRIIRIKASRYKKSVADSEDLVQEGLLALIKAVKAYSPEKGGFAAFANVCIENGMKNFIIKSGSKFIKQDDYDFDQTIDESAMSADELVILKEYSRELQKKLSSLLTEKEYSVLTQYLDGYSYKQIAENMNISTKSVDNSLSRARSKLKESFGK